MSHWQELQYQCSGTHDTPTQSVWNQSSHPSHSIILSRYISGMRQVQYSSISLYGKWWYLLPDFCFVGKAENLLSLKQIRSFGSGQIQPLPIFLLATGAQQTLLRMLHSHPSQSVAGQVEHTPQDEDRLLHLLHGWPKVGKLMPTDALKRNSNHRPWICCHKQQLLSQYCTKWPSDYHWCDVVRSLQGSIWKILKLTS